MSKNNEIETILGEFEKIKLPKHMRAVIGYHITMALLGVILLLMFSGLPLFFTYIFSGIFAFMVSIGFYYIYKDFKILKLRSDITSMKVKYESSHELKEATKVLALILDGTSHAIDGIKIASRKVTYTDKLIVSGKAANPEYAKNFLHDRINDKLYNEELIKYYLLLLEDIRASIRDRVAKELSLLEGAQRELTSVKAGSEGYIAAAALQKTRLDRQIEQFKELQRVLVKV